jgi:hypothetical protein
MKKKTYQKPTSKTIKLKCRQSILAGSGVTVSGLGDDFYYNEQAGDGSDAY